MTIRKSIGLRLTFGWSLAVLLLAFTARPGDPAIIEGFRLLIAAPLVFMATGHLILRALRFVVPSRVEYGVYAVAASIAGCVAGGFALNLVHALTPIGWGAWFVILTGTAAVIASRQHRDGKMMVLPLRLPVFKRWHLIMLAFSVTIAVVTYILAVHDEWVDREFRYDEFWMLPRGPGKELIGILNSDEAPQKLRLEVTADGQIVAHFRDIEMDAGKTWIHTVYTPVSAKKIEAKLYNGDGLYRQVSVATGEPGEPKKTGEE